MKPFPFPSFLPSCPFIFFHRITCVFFLLAIPKSTLLFPSGREKNYRRRKNARDRLNTETVRRIEDSTESAMENSKFFINAFRARRRKSFGGSFDTAEHISYIILRDKEVDGLRGG